jgi:hypothetical protein
MTTRYRGVSIAAGDEDKEAGFRAATRNAVDDYKAKNGTPEPGKPVELRVAEMYVTVKNPIHEFIIVLEPQR